jgi:hypothetical protein
MVPHPDAALMTETLSVPGQNDTVAPVEWCTITTAQARAWCQARMSTTSSAPCVGFGRRRSGCITPFTFVSTSSSQMTPYRTTGVLLSDFPLHFEILRKPTRAECATASPLSSAEPAQARDTPLRMHGLKLPGMDMCGYDSHIIPATASDPTAVTRLDTTVPQGGSFST